MKCGNVVVRLGIEGIRTNAPSERPEPCPSLIFGSTWEPTGHSACWGGPFCYTLLYFVILLFSGAQLGLRFRHDGGVDHTFNNGQQGVGNSFDRGERPKSTPLDSGAVPDDSTKNMLYCLCGAW